MEHMTEERIVYVRSEASLRDQFAMAALTGMQANGQWMEATKVLADASTDLWTATGLKKT